MAAERAANRLLRQPAARAVVPQNGAGHLVPGHVAGRGQKGPITSVDLPQSADALKAHCWHLRQRQSAVHRHRPRRHGVRTQDEALPDQSPLCTGYDSTSGFVYLWF